MIDLSDVTPACSIDGEPWYDFLFEYRWKDGNTYQFRIVARSEAEALQHRAGYARARLVAVGEEVPERVYWTGIALGRLEQGQNESA